MADVETRVILNPPKIRKFILNGKLFQERINLIGKMHNLEHDLEVMRDRLDEDYEQKQEIERMLSKALADANLWRARYETEGVARIEEIERDKGKVALRLSEAEDTIASLHEKLAALEKNKVEDLQK